MAALGADAGDSSALDLALRVYTSRLIGSDPGLVLHGGGNTSVKTDGVDMFGRRTRVMHVKGSGSDLADVGPSGLPAVALEPLLALRALDAMPDAVMVAAVRAQLRDPAAPTPSVEALLHAFLPQKFVDHTHADAILVLTNQPDGEARIREALGPDVEILPWIMPGFPLAKAVADAYERRPTCRGIVLLKHGLFTFGSDAKTSYEAMIEFVDRAERFAARAVAHRERTNVATAAPPTAAAATPSAPLAAPDEIAARLRGALARPVDTPLGPHWQRVVATFRSSPEIVAFTRREDAAALLARGPLTPDHVIRTKGPYLWLDARAAADTRACRDAVAGYVRDYEAYFAANRGRVAGARMTTPTPNVVVVADVGLFAFGATSKAASIAADIAERTLAGKAAAADLGRYEDLPPAELFEMEYWPLERDKLGKASAPVLAGRVALVTGGGGAIGHGIADALLRAGAHVVLTDVDASRLTAAVDLLRTTHGKSTVAATLADVTDAAAVRELFAFAARTFGGVDIVVPNAGVAHVASLADMDPERFRRVVDVNLTGTMLVLRESARWFALQGTGGDVVVQASKNVFDPGASFGAYSASKAGVHQLGKVAALEFAALGVRVNMVNADAVFGDAVRSGLWAEVGPDRMRARGLDAAGLERFYTERSLLKVRVLPAHVGEAVVFFASGRTPTTGATLPVDGGIPGAFPR